MEIEVSQQQSTVPVTVFHIHGNLDADTHYQLEEQAQEAIQQGLRYLVLDLTDVAFISSYGIRSISQVFRLLRDPEMGEDDRELSQGLRDGTYKSRQLKLANPDKNVMKGLKMAGIDMFLEIHANLEEAVASF